MSDPTPRKLTPHELVVIREVPLFRDVPRLLAHAAALEAENARMREALERILKTEYSDCDGSEQKDGRNFCMDQMRGYQCDCFVKIAKAALDARGGAA